MLVALLADAFLSDIGLGLQDFDSHAGIGLLAVIEGFPLEFCAPQALMHSLIFGWTQEGENFKV
ncbi:MAG: hypothetical protein L3J16_07010 [Anaerolineales bacterium]|nr:hypothetical protein [Anaerolineales bacterium]